MHLHDSNSWKIEGLGRGSASQILLVAGQHNVR